MRLSLLLLAAATAACAHLGPAPRTRVVVEEGWAAGGADGAAGGRRRAVTDALLRAVERASGVSLAARTRVRDGAATSQRVVAQADGCVLDYEVLSVRPRDGGTGARVRATVAAGGGPCAGRPALPPAALAGTPVTVRVDGTGPLGGEAAGAAASALRAALAARGWAVVESSAPLRLVGTARLTPAADPRLGGMTGERAELTLRAETAGGARLLRETVALGAAVDADPPSAARRAAAEAAGRAAPGLSDALQEAAWDAETPR